MKGSWDLSMMSKQECVELAGGSNGFGSVDLFCPELDELILCHLKPENDPSSEDISKLSNIGA